MYNSNASTSSAKGKTRLTTAGNILMIGIPLVAIIIMLGLVVEEFTDYTIGTVEWTFYLIGAIIILARQNAKLKAQIRELRK